MEGGGSLARGPVDVSADKDTSLESRSVGGLAWLSSSTALNGVINVGVIAILGRLLTPEEFGLVGAAMVVIWLSTIFSELGVGQALVQRPELRQPHVDSGFSISLILGGLFALLVWLTAPLVEAFFDMEGLVPIVRTLSVLFPITGVSVVAESLLQRDLKFKPIARIEVLSYGVGYSVVSVLMAALGFGVWALVGGNLAKAILKTGLLLVAEPHSKRLSLDPVACRELIRYGGGYTVGRLSTYFALQGDAIVIGRTLGAGPLGLYGRAYSIMTMPAKAGGSVLSRVLFPAMSMVQEERGRLASLYRRGLAAVAVLVLPVSAVAIVVAPELIRVYLGAGWEGAILPFQILAVGMFCRIAYLIGGVVARATGEVYRLAWRNAVYAALVGTGAWIGHFWGLPGTAAGVTVALVLNYLLTSHLANSLVGLSWVEFASEHVRPLLLGLAFGAVSWVLVWWLRRAGAGPLGTLLVGALLPAATGVLLLRFAPRVLLGRHSAWVRRILSEYTPKPIRPLIGASGPSA